MNTSIIFALYRAIYISPVPTIRTVKGRVVFFRAQHEKISTLNPLTVRIFAAAFSPPKTGNRISKPCPRFRPLHFSGKTVCTCAAFTVGFCGASRPASELLVNVWDWDPQWRVEYSEDGGRTFRPMKRCGYDDPRALDPVACEYFGTAGSPRIAARPWIKARVTDHLFRCTPRSERVTIRVVSRFGETRTQQVDL